MSTDMMAMVEAMIAFQRQAGEHLRACAAELTAAGLGFSAEDAFYRQLYAQAGEP